MNSCIQGFRGKCGGNRPVGRLRIRWEDNIKVDLQEVAFETWTGTMWLRVGTESGLLYTR